MKRNGLHKTKKILKAACLGVGLTMASWGGGGNAAMGATVATDYQLSGTISPSLDLSDVYVFYSVNSSGSAYNTYDENVGSAPDGVDTDFSFVVENPSFWDSDTYTVLGLYDSNSDATPDGVTVGMNPSDASDAIGSSRDWSYYFGEDESDVMSWLSTGDLTALTNFFSNNFPDGLGQSSGNALTLVNFSTAVDGGEAFAEVAQVPLPSTLVLLASGLSLALLKRRKKA